jgi:hypothetical protein
MRIAVFTNDNSIKAIFHQIAFEHSLDYKFNPRSFKSQFDYIVVDKLSLTNHRREKLLSIKAKKILFRAENGENFDYIFDNVSKDIFLQTIFGDIIYYHTKAQEYFYSQNHINTIFCLSQILSIDSSNKEATLLIKLADLEFKNEANAMFNYYLKIKKEQGTTIACDVLNNAIDVLDAALNSLHSNTTYISPLDTINGITYQDFLKYTYTNDNLSEAIENTLLSTKVAFNTRDEVFKFINQLIDYNFTDMALLYVEKISHIYPVDERVQILLNKIKIADTKLENKTKQ